MSKHLHDLFAEVIGKTPTTAADALGVRGVGKRRCAERRRAPPAVTMTGQAQQP